MSFVSLSDLIPLARLSSTILNGNDESHGYCLVVDLKSFQVFIVGYNVRFGFFLNMTLIIWGTSPPNFMFFNQNRKGILNTVKCFKHLLVISYSFILFLCQHGVTHWLIIICCTILAFQGEIPVDHVLWSFTVLLNWVCYNYVEDCCINVHKECWFAVLFSYTIFVWLWHQGNIGLISLGLFPPLYYFGTV